MRNTFINEVFALAQKDPRVFLVVGDLGYAVVDQFAKELPEQFLNAGVAEQNMTGLAAGLALASDRIVLTYSIANFPTLRCFEQIRNDVCYHNANVKVVSVGSGLAYGTQGYTHFGIEDVGVMRTLPNMVVASPCDPLEARALAHLAVMEKGPWYIRLNKNKEPNLHAALPSLKVGEPVSLRSGSDGVIFASGAVTAEALKAVDQLAEQGLQVSLLSVPFLKPLSTQTIVAILGNHPWALSVEEHSGVGGLGSALSEILAQHMRTPKPFRALHLPGKIDQLGDQDYLRALYGLDSQGIARAARTLSSEL